MKVMRGVLASIGLAVVLAVPRPLAAADATTCSESWYLCINDTREKDGLARTWAEQKCNYRWYNCVKEQALGS